MNRETAAAALRDRRAELGLSLDDASHETLLRKSVLESLEAGGPDVFDGFSSRTRADMRSTLAWMATRWSLASLAARANPWPLRAVRWVLLPGRDAAAPRCPSTVRSGASCRFWRLLSLRSSWQQCCWWVGVEARQLAPVMGLPRPRLQNLVLHLPPTRRRGTAP